MFLKNEKLKEILIKQHYLVEDDFKNLDKDCKDGKKDLSDCLLNSNIISKDILGQALAEWYKIPYADLNSIQPSRDQVLKIKSLIAKKYRIVIFNEDEEKITITTDNPKQKGLESTLKTLFPKKKIIIAFSVSQDIDNVFVYYRKALNTKFSSVIKNSTRFAPEIVDLVIEDAYFYNSSDIHFEPLDDEVLIRFRIDGLLQEAGRIEKKYYENILNRIKIQSELRIDEHNKPQDGAIRFNLKKGTPVDLRISIIPTLNGEKIVIRLLSEYIKDLSLRELGFSSKAEEIIEKSVKRPFGLILSVGPTGSGKTTTLYTILKQLNHPELNVTTIEDPVEFKIAGINQIQVNNESGLTFAKGLRSIVRQDPNVILVGEIRDRETAEISVNSALTGHLVLSTFHANDAATAIPRLIDMGVEPFLLSSTLEIIVAQRLARKLCEHCRYSERVNKKFLSENFPATKEFLKEDKYTIFKSKGCDACNHTGYKGRVGLFEIVHITPNLKDLIMTNPSTAEIWKTAKKEGAITLFEDGFEKVKRGITSLEEVMRVAPPLI